MVVTNQFVSSLLEVLTLFLIPAGGGIPSGVLLAQKRSLSWPLIMAVYFVSDVILACVFEPIMLFVAAKIQRSSRLSQWAVLLRQEMKKLVSRYGVRPGPLNLVLLSFSTDPMTGRTVNFAAGYGFIAGWLIAIAGDMVFFSIVMVSTLWLNQVLGNGTWAVALVLLAMFVFIPFARWVFKKMWQMPVRE